MLHDNQAASLMTKQHGFEQELHEDRGNGASPVTGSIIILGVVVWSRVAGPQECVGSVRRGLSVFRASRQSLYTSLDPH